MCLNKAACRQQLETVVAKAAAAVNAAVLQRVQQQGLFGGTTAIFALVSGPQILLGHLGDSKAIICRAQPSTTTPAARHDQQFTKTAAPSTDQQKLQAAALTCDHSPDRPDELRRITAAGGFVSRASAGDIQSSLLRSAAPVPDSSLSGVNNVHTADNSANPFVAVHNPPMACHEPQHTELGMGLSYSITFLS